MRADRDNFNIGVSEFRTQLLESIGLDGQALLRHADTGHANVTPADIWELMAIQHGNVRSVDIRDKYKELSYIPPGQSLAAFVISSKQIHTFFELSNQPLNQITKCSEFNTAIAFDKQLTRLQYQYCTLEQPDFSLQNFADLSAYVLKREKTENPEFEEHGRPRDLAYGLASASAANAPHLPDKHNEIIKLLQSIASSIDGLQLASLRVEMEKATRDTPPDPGKAATSNPKVYCFYHGHNHDHAGIDCQAMRLQPDKYNSAMKAAIGPCLIDGVQGSSRYIR